ncbi:MAG: glycosyltransferase family 2 protein [Lachnospiraceae bacterium]|nr:glycosyltransferase family 2 protein [Lachnospiraceae bacterium]
MKDVTVLIPVFNGSRYISTCLENMLSQSYTNYKILVVDDGSTDDTLAILQRYPVEVISYKENKGISHALNLGIERIDTKYTVRMDGDDISHVDRIKIQVDFMEKNPHIFMCGTTVTENKQADKQADPRWKLAFGDKRVTTVNELQVFYLYHTYLLHPTTIFRTQEWKKKGYCYDSRFDGVEDFELYRRIIMEEEVYQLHLPLVALTKRQGSASDVGVRKTLERLYQANKYFYESFGLSSDTIRLLAKTLFPRQYGTTQKELEDIERFTYELMKIDYFNKRIKPDIVHGLFRYLYEEVKKFEKA